MKPSENSSDKRLDDALIKAISSEKSEPNFQQWQEKHPEAVEMQGKALFGSPGDDPEAQRVVQLLARKK